MFQNFYKRPFLFRVSVPHLSDPGDERGHPGEDRGLQGGVAGPPVHEASHAFHVPLSVAALAVQRASGVALRGSGEDYQCFRLKRALLLLLLLTWHADLLAPPAQTMVVFAELPHQSLRLQVA